MAISGSRWIVSATELIGEAVHGSQGELLGRIDDVMVDATDGRLAYVVLALEGSESSAQSRLFVIPWEALAIDTARGGDGWRLDADRIRLERAPGFDRGRWPNFADPQFALAVYDHYGISPYWERS
ncbi:MAG: PRC-barrel domain-containing protein [Bdellovibrionaceae bacterium]|nr:PRC-barrel domain-containing protein [Pseudobdellovibrionaceae bacterium]